ncbi:MAG: PhnD/SsuA/transferrin family substrate-binding protein [Chloroflexi bacterium]|nr:PhnD/SsuA/transferrin family substrate-binding protein [Chloroflexota bacterium]
MRPPLRVASHLAPGVLPLYAFLADYLADSLGRRAEFSVATSYERCSQDVDDVCFVCSVPYLLFAELGHIHMQVVAAPVLIGARYSGRPIYFSDVVVHADSRYERFADLRGATSAYNEPFSHSGYLVVWHHLLSMGEGAGFFGQMVEAGFHAEALRMVAEGSVDAAAIDSQVLAIELRDHRDLAKRLRSIGTIGPSTIQPVVASTSRLTAAERASRFLVSAAYQSRPIASNRSIACSINASSPRAKPNARRAKGSRYVAGFNIVGASCSISARRSRATSALRRAMRPSISSSPPTFHALSFRSTSARSPRAIPISICIGSRMKP